MSKILPGLKTRNAPVALTIAGSDSGGGAGIQADLNTFAALGVHGTSVVTCITAQNPRRIIAIEESSPRIVAQQLSAVFEEFSPAAVKTGMLYSPEIIKAVARFFEQLPKRPPLIVDPVLVATSGRRLMGPGAKRVLCEELLPLASLVTPNVAEAEALTSSAVREPEHMRRAARFLWNKFGCAALVKGGHLRGMREAMDVLYDGNTELLLTAPYLNGVSLHGTGCTYSAAITAYLARGAKFTQALEAAKDYITQAIFRNVKTNSNRNSLSKSQFC